MRAEVGFDKLSVHCIVGVSDEERKKPQELMIALKVTVDISDAVLSDALEDTVCYSRLSLLCKQVAQEGNFHLLESLAAAILEKVFLTSRVLGAKMRLTKLKNNAFVELVMER